MSHRSHTCSENICGVKWVQSEARFKILLHFENNWWKLLQFVASIIPATFLMCASHAGCDELLAVIFFTISISAHGFNSAGAAINLFDLSPNYIAPLNAVINSLATVVGICAPYIAGLLTPNVCDTFQIPSSF